MRSEIMLAVQLPVTRSVVAADLAESTGLALSVFALSIFASPDFSAAALAFSFFPSALGALSFFLSAGLSSFFLSAGLALTGW